ncbi:MAG: M28 family peptidase [Acidobacteriota bacterium]|nr:M28 family peptidase [Acidobacteriota bacterium]
MELKGRVAVYFNSSPAEMTPEQRTRFVAARVHLLAERGVAGVVAIDNPAATEPTHWPAAYAHSVTIAAGDASAAPNAAPAALVGLRISAEAAPKLFAGTGTDASAILAAAEKGLPLDSMELKRSLRVRLSLREKEISSPNILAVLPGSDPKLSAEYVALSAHLDGYGFGAAVDGDTLYNGTLDDAAYVATLLELAHRQAAKPPARSLLFCIFTGEEKGLLGSVFFTQHPTVPIRSIVADLNLDQLRPIFPLRILTMEGITDSTLAETAGRVASKYGIELRPDHEPERNLFRRADNYSFVRVGVPIASFIFGYDPGTEEGRLYRDWYARRYHKPQDDLDTPIDWEAAVKFNRFYGDLAGAVADAASRPEWLSGSPNAPKR